MQAGEGTDDRPRPRSPCAGDHPRRRRRDGTRRVWFQGTARPSAPPTEAAAAAPTAAVATSDSAAPVARSPEALEELLAPVALYPDPVLSQVLIASTNPQEVLDAGNWLIANESLKGKALDEAAAQIGFTPPVRALRAVSADHRHDVHGDGLDHRTRPGVRRRPGRRARCHPAAARAGAWKSATCRVRDAMLVETTEQEGKDVVVLKPAAARGRLRADLRSAGRVCAAPLPLRRPRRPRPTTADTGHSTGSMIATGVLAFGAGILVSEIFDDDDDDWDNGYYYPNYGYGGMPYYPPYPYRPSYGGGYYPSNGYNRPPNYNSGWQNNGTIVINNPGGGGGYWDRYDNNRAGATSTSTPPARAARSRRPSRIARNSTSSTSASHDRCRRASSRRHRRRPRPTGRASRRTQARRSAPKALRVILRRASPRPTRGIRAPPSGNKAKGPAPKGAGFVCRQGHGASRPRRSTRTCRSRNRRRATCSVRAAAAQRDRGYAAPATRDVKKPTSKPQTMPTTRQCRPLVGNAGRRQPQHGHLRCEPRQCRSRCEPARQAEHAAGRAQQGQQPARALRPGERHEEQTDVERA